MTLDKFDYCELKFGTCICRKNGKCSCALVEREFQDPTLVESARVSKAQKEHAKRAKYIDDETPRRTHEMMRIVMQRYMSPIARMDGIDKAMLEPPSWAGIDFKQAEDRIRRTLLEKKYIQRDMAIIDELSFMKPIGEFNPREDSQSLRERRLGIADLPKEKRKPHHAFLEDPTRRRKR